MKNVLHLTNEEGNKVIEALHNVAVENGWNPDELEDCGVIEEYCTAVDAALTAMGIEVRIEPNPAEEEDEDEDEMESIIFEVEGRRVISGNDAILLMSCVAKNIGEQYDILPDDIVDDIVQEEFMRITDAYGIDGVNVSE